ncbi:19106_t:CDS:2 [Entrophospora sp. SA101]|nr:19106_t:CDS:2 [Entrophospora sp. SA101]CAJ0882861.1 8932_t:CDS:2 [Entrophospora sp. SA101]
MSSSITSSSDPKRPNAAVPYHSPIKDIDEIDRDIYGITSLLLSTIGLVLKIKFASWTALMFAVVSVTNEKISDQDPNSGRTSGFTALSNIKHMSSDKAASLLTRTEQRHYRKKEAKRIQAYEIIEKFEKSSCINLFSSEATKYLCLVNVCYGGVGGVTSEQLTKLFEKYEGWVGVNLTHGKPYSFVIFQTALDAFHARESLHDKQCEILKGKIIFIEFVNLSYQNFINQINHNKNKNHEKIPGLILLEEFISFDLEKIIINHVNSIDTWIQIQNRFVSHYGYKFNYDTNKVDELNLKFPYYIKSLLEKLKNLYPSLTIPDMQQLTIQIYPVGTGIPPHVDSHSSFGDTILSFSLGSSIIMEFKNFKTGEVVNVDLPKRSLAILQDDARYLWSHTIRARKSDLLDNGLIRERDERISLTLRAINTTSSCNCSFPEICDNDKLI